MGVPLPIYLGHGNEGFEIFQTDKMPHKRIVKQHIAGMGEAFKVLSRSDIHDIRKLHDPIMGSDLNPKSITSVNVSRFLTQVTNALEQLTFMDGSTALYMGATPNPAAIDKLSEAWQKATENKGLIQQFKLMRFPSEHIQKLCTLVAECHVMASVDTLNPIIRRLVEEMPDPRRSAPVTPAKEEQPPTAEITQLYPTPVLKASGG